MHWPTRLMYIPAGQIPHRPPTIMSRPLNDDEVITELKKMVAFIRQEATEEAHEIQVKADEEFAIEKARPLLTRLASSVRRLRALTRPLSARRRTSTARRRCAFTLTSAKSHRSNKARLELLEAREKHLQGLFEAATEGLRKLSNDTAAYKGLQAKLLLQGLLRLCEPEVTVTVRSTDVQTIQDLVPDAQSKFKEATGRDTQITVKEGLPSDSAGGMKLSALGGRIVVDNTLEERLNILEDKMLPELRFELFGANPNRKCVAH